jgi:hypothetical protein
LALLRNIFLIAQSKLMSFRGFAMLFTYELVNFRFMIAIKNRHTTNAVCRLLAAAFAGVALAVFLFAQPVKNSAVIIELTRNRVRIMFFLEKGKLT